MNKFNPEEIMGAIGGDPTDYIGVRLGYQFFNLEAFPCRYDEVMQILEELGMEEYSPNRPSPANAFRRLTSQIGGYYHFDDMSYKVDVIRVNSDTTSIERIIMLIEVDQENKEVSDGRKVARLVFDKQTNNFDMYTGPYGQFDYCPDWLANRLASQQEAYDSYINYLSPQQMRDLVIKILLKSGNPIRNIKSLWNIPASRVSMAEMLENFAMALNEYAVNTVDADDEIERMGGVLFIDTLPIVNTSEQRKKVSANVIAFALEKLNRNLAKEKDNVVSALDTEKAREKAKARFRAEANEMMELITEYETLLGEVLDEVRQARRITEKNLNDFCADPEKEADHRTQLASRRGNGGRKLQILQQEDKSSFEAKNTPARRFNLVGDQSLGFQEITNAQKTSK